VLGRLVAQRIFVLKQADTGAHSCSRRFILFLLFFNCPLFDGFTHFVLDVGAPLLKLLHKSVFIFWDSKFFYFLVFSIQSDFQSVNLVKDQFLLFPLSQVFYKFVSLTSQLFQSLANQVGNLDLT
jgi:hypothetical protein